MCDIGRPCGRSLPLASPSLATSVLEFDLTIHAPRVISGVQHCMWCVLPHGRRRGPRGAARRRGAAGVPILRKRTRPPPSSEPHELTRSPSAQSALRTRHRPTSMAARHGGLPLSAPPGNDGRPLQPARVSTDKRPVSTPLLRVKYVSRFSRPLSTLQVETLARRSAERNAAADMTGVLAAVGEIFLQILEGPPAQVDAVLKRIANDSRHREMLVLRRTAAHTSRCFPSWSMRLLNVGSGAREAARSIADLLDRFERASQLERTAVLASIDHEVWDVLSRAARIEGNGSLG